MKCQVGKLHSPCVSSHEVSEAVSLSPKYLVLKPTHLPPASGKCSVHTRKQPGFNSGYGPLIDLSEELEWTDKLKACTRHVLGPSLSCHRKDNRVDWEGRGFGIRAGL